MNVFESEPSDYELVINALSELLPRLTNAYDFSSFIYLSHSHVDLHHTSH